MFDKHIFLSLWLLASVPMIVMAQENKYEDQDQAVADQHKSLSFKVDRPFAERIAINEILFKQEVYQLLGVNSPQFLKEQPLTMTYAHIGKSVPSVLSDSSDTTSERRFVNVSQVNSSNHPIKHRDNLAPLIQITF